VNVSTPVVSVKEADVADDPPLSTRILELEIAFEDASKTLTLIPSIPSTTASVVGVTLKVVDVEPEAIVAVPDRTSISLEPALSTVPPFVSPITVQEKVVSAETAVLDVIVNVTSLPSVTFVPEDVTV
jgi:hypothetical protein